MQTSNFFLWNNFISRNVSSNLIGEFYTNPPKPNLHLAKCVSLFLDLSNIKFTNRFLWRLKQLKSIGARCMNQLKQNQILWVMNNNVLVHWKWERKIIQIGSLLTFFFTNFGPKWQITEQIWQIFIYLYIQITYITYILFCRGLLCDVIPSQSCKSLYSRRPCWFPLCTEHYWNIMFYRPHS